MSDGYVKNLFNYHYEIMPKKLLQALAIHKKI